MPLPDDWKKLSDLPKLTSAQLMAGDEVIMLTVGNKGARSELREIQSIIIDETFNATQLPGGVESNDTVIIKRGGDYFVATMNQVLGGVVSALEEYPTLGDFPTPGDGNTAYVALDTGVTYRWSGSTYVAVMPSLALGETDSTAYRGDRGKIAYDHVARSDNPHGVTAAQVGARPVDWVPEWGDVSGKPSTFPPSSHTHDAGDIDSGTLSTDRIPDLDADKITSGTLSKNRLPELDISDIGGLGTAATHDVTTSATDTTAGRVLKVGDFGFGSRAATTTPPGASSSDWKSFFKKGAPTTFNYGAGSDSRVNYGRALFASLQSGDTVVESAIFMGATQPRVFYAQMRGDITNPGLEPTLVELYSTGNTTVDGNGFIKKASPIVKLFNDHIEHEGFNQETPTMTKLDTGVYEIKGTSGLAKRGWYIETPTDRNNDAYFNTEWEQTPYEIPIDENGQTTEPQNVTLLIKTFERVWDAGAGRFTNGAPVDIDVAAGPDRFIALRFTGVKPVDEEPEAQSED